MGGGEGGNCHQREKYVAAECGEGGGRAEQHPSGGGQEEQYASIMYSPPWAGLPISEQLPRAG